MNRKEYNRLHRTKRRLKDNKHLNSIQRAWWAKLDPKEKRFRAREYRLKTRYGLTSKDYDNLLEKQNGLCPVCLKHHTEFKESFVVDHLHTSPWPVRGLLCRSCNHWVVGKNTDPEIMRRAADYVENARTGFFCPDRKKKKRRKRRKKKK